MAANELEVHQIGDKFYVFPKDAARYLGIKHKTLLGYIRDYKLEVVYIESRQFIEHETLIAFAKKRSQTLWDRLDEWRK